MTKLDAKFYGTIQKVKDGSIVPEDQYMVFLVKDRAFLPTLYFYREQCRTLGADAEHIAAVDRTIERAKAWQDAHPELMKVPDAKGEKLAG
jgi:hypothetical protein